MSLLVPPMPPVRLARRCCVGPCASRFTVVECFQNRKTDIDRKLANWNRDESVLAGLADACLPPIRVELGPSETQLPSGMGPDAVVAVRWGERECLFACEAKGRSTPKTVDAAIAQACRYSALLGLRPLIVVPYLSEEHLAWLEREEVSGLDLCGNAVVLAPGFRVWRSGRPNLYKDSAPIRNVFGGVSSLIVRSLVLGRAFPSLKSLHEFTISRIASGRLSLGTVSKVVTVLEEERLVDRSADGLRPADPRAMLRRLLQGLGSRPMLRFEGRSELTHSEAWQRLETYRASTPGSRCTTTGLGSAMRYGVLSTPRRLSLYVSDLAATRGLLGVQETHVFPNVELVEDGSEVAHFDRRVEGGIAWASPVQTWLELMKAGPREREAADALEQMLVQGGRDSL